MRTLAALMVRTVLTGLVAAAAATAQSPSGQPPSGQPPMFESASSDLVVVPVTVTDRDGRFITDLRQGAFAVFDNGRRQDVALFSGEDTPVTVGLVIDDSQSMQRKMPSVVAAALAFARSSNPEDELFAIAFNDTVSDAIPGRPLAASDLDALQRTLTSLVPEGRTALYDAVLAAIDRVRDGTAPRKAIIVISDGGDNASVARLKDVELRARQDDATIYTVGLFDRDDFDQNPGVLKALARETGGERFIPEGPAALMQVCRQIARAIRSGYTVAFVPPDRDGAYHQLRVIVDAGDGRRLNVRTRPGYVAPTPPLGENDN